MPAVLGEASRGYVLAIAPEGGAGAQVSWGARLQLGPKRDEAARFTVQC